MSDAQFLRVAQTTLDALERALEALVEANEIDLDLDRQANILTLEWADGAQIVIHSHARAQEIWVAARSGGFHCQWREGRWVDGRTQQELDALLSGLLSVHSGRTVVVVRS